MNSVETLYRRWLAQPGLPEDPAAELLLSGALSRGGRAVVDAAGGALTVSPEQAVSAVPDHPLETQTQQDRSF